MTVLKHLEMHVVDVCNLNCKGCAHFCNIIENNNYPFEEFYKDLVRMSKLVDHIEVIKLLGGEPFLSPILDQYIKAVGEIFPKSKVHVITNGLLISKATPEFWDVVYKNNVHIEVSVYPPTAKIIDQIKNVLSTYNITYTTLPVGKFGKRLRLNAYKGKTEAFKSCTLRDCQTLYKGGLSFCPSASYSHIFDNHFGSHLEYKEDVLNIFDDNLTGQDILNHFNKPLDLCGHCDRNPVLFDWSNTNTSKYQQSDWIVSENEGNSDTTSVGLFNRIISGIWNKTKQFRIAQWFHQKIRKY